jgi:hypothetical protein
VETKRGGQTGALMMEKGGRVVRGCSLEEKRGGAVAMVWKSSGGSDGRGARERPRRKIRWLSSQHPSNDRSQSSPMGSGGTRREKGNKFSQFCYGKRRGEGTGGPAHGEGERR